MSQKMQDPEEEQDTPGSGSDDSASLAAQPEAKSNPLAPGSTQEKPESTGSSKDAEGKADKEAGDELPEWLAQAPVKETPDSGEALPDWLKQMRGLEVPYVPVDEPQPESRPTGDIPAWLEDASEASPAEPVGEAPKDEEIPDWLIGFSASKQATDEIPDERISSLDQLTEESPNRLNESGISEHPDLAKNAADWAVAPGRKELPDNPEKSKEAHSTEPAGEIPDWLLETTVTPSSSTETPEYPPPAQSLAAPEGEGMPGDQLPEWLIRAVAVEQAAEQIMQEKQAQSGASDQPPLQDSEAAPEPGSYEDIIPVDQLDSLQAMESEAAAQDILNARSEEELPGAPGDNTGQSSGTPSDEELDAVRKALQVEEEQELAKQKSTGRLARTIKAATGGLAALAVGRKAAEPPAPEPPSRRRPTGDLAPQPPPQPEEMVIQLPPPGGFEAIETEAAPGEEPGLQSQADIEQAGEQELAAEPSAQTGPDEPAAQPPDALPPDTGSLRRRTAEEPPAPVKRGTGALISAWLAGKTARQIQEEEQLDLTEEEIEGRLARLAPGERLNLARQRETPPVSDQGIPGLEDLVEDEHVETPGIFQTEEAYEDEQARIARAFLMGPDDYATVEQNLFPVEIETGAEDWEVTAPAEWEEGDEETRKIPPGPAEPIPSGFEELRQVALEDYVPPEPEPVVSIPETRRRRVRWVALAAGAMVVVTLCACAAGAFFMRGQIISALMPFFTPAQQPPAVASGPAPIRLVLPGGWPFLLFRGRLADGQWNPQTAEWLEGTEINRFIALPWSKELEAVFKAVQPGDAIELQLDNFDRQKYEISFIKQVPREMVASMWLNEPSLTIVMADQDSEMRWIIVAFPE